MKARDLMSTDPVVVPPETPVAALAELLAMRGISAVPVVDAAGAPVGVVTEGDLIRRLADEAAGPLGWFFGQFRDPSGLADRFAKAHGATARDVMTSPPITVGEDAGADEIAHLMEQRRIRRVLVVRDGRLQGVVSRADLLRAAVRPRESGSGAADDAAILRAVAARMREQPWADTFWSFAAVQDGVVSLHGYARTDAVRRGLRVLAEAVPGVVRVEDRMEPMPRFLRYTF